MMTKPVSFKDINKILREVHSTIDEIPSHEFTFGGCKGQRISVHNFGRLKMKRDYGALHIWVWKFGVKISPPFRKCELCKRRHWI